MSETTFAVFVHERGKRPRRVTELEPELRRGAPVIPQTFTVDGQTFFWNCVDLSRRTLTYIDWKPAPAAVAS